MIVGPLSRTNTVETSLYRAQPELADCYHCTSVTLVDRSMMRCESLASFAAVLLTIDFSASKRRYGFIRLPEEQGKERGGGGGSCGFRARLGDPFRNYHRCDLVRSPLRDRGMLFGANARGTSLLLYPAAKLRQNF